MNCMHPSCLTSESLLSIVCGCLRSFMKLRLDRVLRLDLGEMTREEVTKSVGKVPEYGALDKSKWTAPYSPYRPGWWEMFIVKEQH